MKNCTHNRFVLQSVCNVQLFQSKSSLRNHIKIFRLISFLYQGVVPYGRLQFLVSPFLSGGVALYADSLLGNLKVR